MLSISIITKENKEYTIEQYGLRTDIQDGILLVELDESAFDGNEDIGTIKVTIYNHNNGKTETEYRSVFKIGLSKVSEIITESVE